MIREQAQEEAPRPAGHLPGPACLAQRRRQPPPRGDLGEVGSVMVVIAGQHLVAALTVEQDRNAGRPRHLHHPELGVDARRRERLVLVAHERGQVGEQLGRGRRRAEGLDARGFHDRAHVRRLVEAGVGIDDAEGAVPSAAGLIAPPCGEADRIGEQLADLARVGGDLARLRQRVPAADLERARAEVQRQTMTARQAFDPVVEGTVALVDRALDEEGMQRPLVGPARHRGVREEALDLGREREQPVGGMVVERLHAEAVAGAEEPPRARVVEREGPHAVEAGERLGAPFRVGGEQHLGVRAGVEGVPEALQLRPQLDVVEDLAVVGDPEPPVGRAHGLVAGGAQVDDGEPPVAEAEVVARRRRLGQGGKAGHLHGVGPAVRGRAARDAVGEEITFVVGAAVPQRRRHGLQRAQRLGGPAGHPRDAAHGAG